MMSGRPVSISKKESNKAIHEILLKIHKKWSAGPGSDIPLSKESFQAGNGAEKGGADFQNEKIIKETVLLRFEDYQMDSPAQKIPEDGDILKTGQTTQNANEDTAVAQTGESEENIPETAVFSPEVLKTDKSSENDEIPETRIFNKK